MLERYKIVAAKQLEGNADQTGPGVGTRINIAPTTESTAQKKTCC